MKLGEKEKEDGNCKANSAFIFKVTLKLWNDNTIRMETETSKTINI